MIKISNNFAKNQNSLNMKRILFLATIIIAIIHTVSAQIAIEQSGRSVFGQYPPYNPLPGTLSAQNLIAKRDIGDTTATVQIFHRFDNDKPAYINIGSNCWIGQHINDKKYLMLRSTAGVKMMRQNMDFTHGQCMDPLG